MKKYLFILTAIFIYATAINAQGFDPSKLSFGGNLGLGFGSNNYFGISANPQVGYNFTSKFVSGVGLSYSYSKESANLWNGGGDWKYSRNYVGVNLFANYYPVSYLVVTARPEVIRMWQDYTQTGSGGSNYSTTDVVPTLVVGAGVRLRPTLITLNYDLIQDKNSPYSNSVFLSVGVMF